MGNWRERANAAENKLAEAEQRLVAVSSVARVCRLETEVARLAALLDVSERKLGEWRDRGAEEKRFREALRDLMASDLDPAEWVRAKQRARAALRGGGESVKKCDTCGGPRLACECCRSPETALRGGGCCEHGEADHESAEYRGSKDRACMYCDASGQRDCSCKALRGGGE